MGSAPQPPDRAPGERRGSPGLRVVAIGGGTGLSTLLKGLRHYVTSPGERRRRTPMNPASTIFAPS